MATTKGIMLQHFLPSPMTAIVIITTITTTTIGMTMEEEVQYVAPGEVFRGTTQMKVCQEPHLVPILEVSYLLMQQYSLMLSHPITTIGYTPRQMRSAR